MMKRVFLLSLIMVLGFTSLHGAKSGTIGTPFRDVSMDYWAFQAINGAVQRGYVDGFEDRTFRPKSNVTREQFTKMLMVGAGYSLCDCPDQVFKDVKPNHWATPFIQTAIKEGILYPSDYGIKFEGSKAITRLEMAKMAVRVLLGKKEGPMYQAVKLGVLKGYPTQDPFAINLKPEGLTNRAEAVVVIERVLTVKSGGTLPVDKKDVEKAEVAEFGSNAETVMGVPMRDFNKNPLKVDMGAFDVEILKVLIYDETNPDTAYYPMFEHAKIAEVTRGKYYRLAFEIKLVNKTNDRRYASVLDTTWHMESDANVNYQDAEKFGYLRLNAQKVEPHSSVIGYVIFGVGKDTIKNYGEIRLQIDTRKGTHYIYLQDKR